MAKKRKSTAKQQQQQPTSKKIEKPPPPPPSSDESEYESEEEEETEEEDYASELEDEDSKRETVKKILQPLGKDQIVNLIKEAAANNPLIVTEIVDFAESDHIQRKIFVFGLGWDATNETLISAFKSYGPIEDCNVVTDKATGRAKGYAFLLFKTRSGARKALKQPQKMIGNRTITCQLAYVGSDASARKLYVANVGPQMSLEKVREFFSKFGEIEDGPLGIDKATGKFRGFAFIIYKTVEGIKKALEEPIKVFDGVKLQCSLASKSANQNHINNNNNNVADSLPSGSRVVTFANQAAVPCNIGIAGLPVGLNQGIVGQNALLLGPTPALGVLNPVLGLGVGVGAGGMLSNTELSSSLAAGGSQPLNKLGNTASMGLSAAIAMPSGVNTISPNIIASYGSQAALQGLGAYQTSQSGQPSAPSARSQAGVGSIPPYFGR